MMKLTAKNKKVLISTIVIVLLLGMLFYLGAFDFNVTSTGCSSTNKGTCDYFKASFPKSPEFYIYKSDACTTSQNLQGFNYCADDTRSDCNRAFYKNDVITCKQDIACTPSLVDGYRFYRNTCTPATWDQCRDKPNDWYPTKSKCLELCTQNPGFKVSNGKCVATSYSACGSPPENFFLTEASCKMALPPVCNSTQISGFVFGNNSCSASSYDSCGTKPANFYGTESECKAKIEPVTCTLKPVIGFIYDNGACRGFDYNACVANAPEKFYSTQKECTDANPPLVEKSWWTRFLDWLALIFS